MARAIRNVLESLCQGSTTIQNEAKNVKALLDWLDDKDSPLSIPKRYYQRNSERGWTRDQKGEFLASVLADRAKAPIVINKVSEICARVMDGGHRLKALQDFKGEQVPILVHRDDKRVEIFWRDMDKKSRITFERRSMNVLIYCKLSLHDEIREYLNLNSGLPFSLGEKIGAVKKINMLRR